MEWGSIVRWEMTGIAMKRHWIASACLCLLAVTPMSAGADSPRSGIDVRSIDRSVRPQDDFYRFANGHWLDNVTIPLDSERVTPSSQLTDAIRLRLRAIVDGTPPDSPELAQDWRKLAALYRSFLDERTVASRGIGPIDDLVTQIHATATPSALVELMGELGRVGVVSPFSNSVLNDAAKPSIYALTIYQSGLGMPDRSYYLEQGEPFASTRVAYLKHVEAMLRLGGDAQADAHAAAVVALETELAQAQWTAADSSDPLRTQNVRTIRQLARDKAGLDWPAYFKGAAAKRITSVVIAQPSYFDAVGKLVRERPADTWQAYLHYQLLTAFAPYLSAPFVDEDFAFNSTRLRGIEHNTARWERALDLVEATMGEGLGRIYVAQYFPPSAKAHLQIMVKHLVEAYGQEIDAQAWMAPETRQKAKAKLATLRVKIGYPDHWRDYAGLTVLANDLAGNVRRARTFEYLRNMAKLGTPVDVDEWYITPQTVDAYQYPPQNEVVFPAGLMQPPFFDPDAEDAANYGAIGATIGHEISHGFDNIGSQYGADGRLLGKPGWFTPRDQARFDARTHGVAVLYDSIEVLPGHFVNGQQTLSENVADNAGLAMAYRAYHLSLQGRQAPVIDGFTGDQRFFLAWAQKWRAKVRDNETIRLLKSNEHSPRQVRGQVVVRNQDAFFPAFDVTPQDAMYLAPDKRVTVW